jgi:hypothetical protein
MSSAWHPFASARKTRALPADALPLSRGSWTCLPAGTVAPKRPPTAFPPSRQSFSSRPHRRPSTPFPTIASSLRAIHRTLSARTPPEVQSPRSGFVQPWNAANPK